MPFAELRGQRFYYEDTGGDGPAIVLSHGLLMDQTMFRHQRVLLEGWRVLSLGMSQGGFLSLRLALRHPSRVRGLVLVSSQAAVDSPESVAGFGQLAGACHQPHQTLVTRDDVEARLPEIQVPALA